MEKLPKGVFKGLSNLIIFEIKDNHLTKLPAGIFKELSELRELDLSWNRIKELKKGAFEELERLEDLILESNGLKKFPENVFGKLERLGYLDLKNNDITELPDDVSGEIPFSLSHLHLGSNRIKVLSEQTLDSLSGLTELEGNPLDKDSSRKFRSFVDRGKVVKPASKGLVVGLGD